MFLNQPKCMLLDNEEQVEELKSVVDQSLLAGYRIYRGEDDYVGGVKFIKNEFPEDDVNSSGIGSLDDFMQAERYIRSVFLEAKRIYANNKDDFLIFPDEKSFRARSSFEGRKMYKKSFIIIQHPDKIEVVKNRVDGRIGTFSQADLIRMVLDWGEYKINEEKDLQYYVEQGDVDSLIRARLLIDSILAKYELGK